MKKYFSLFLVILLIITYPLFSQDLTYSRKILDSLCSPYMEGRGYVNSGDRKAAGFIGQEFVRMGLHPIFTLEEKDTLKSFFQPFPISVNSFPGKLTLSINDSTLIPGKDFLIKSSSPGINGKFPVTPFTKEVKKNKKAFLLIDKENWKNESKNLLLQKSFAGIVVQNGKCPWDISDEISTLPVILLFGEQTIPSLSTLTIDVENKYLKNYISQNIAGLLPGNEKKDSLIVISAHYDHLGRMGSDTYFPGANDNTSGVTMLLCMADYFSKRPKNLSCSILFICFSGEEAGLIGSIFFTENSPVELKKIKMLINLDLVGYGEEGMMVQNAPSYLREFKIMDSINNANKFLVKLKTRGNAPNSDHYPFSMKGVPAFFVYTLGGNKAYHDIYDKPENITLEYFSGIFQLLKIFIEQL